MACRYSKNHEDGLKSSKVLETLGVDDLQGRLFLNILLCITQICMEKHVLAKSLKGTDSSKMTSWLPSVTWNKDTMEELTQPFGTMRWS